MNILSRSGRAAMFSYVMKRFLGGGRRFARLGQGGPRFRRRIPSSRWFGLLRLSHTRAVACLPFSNGS